VEAAADFVCGEGVPSVALDAAERALDAIEYELTRAAEPDCRDEDGPEVERIMRQMESSNG
jgi:hypothetical protein